MVGEQDDLFPEGSATAASGDGFGWGDVSEPVRVEVPTGVYSVIVENAEMSYTEAGAPMVTVTYRITEGDQADKRVYGAGGNLFYSEKALPYTKERLAILLGEAPSSKVRYRDIGEMAAADADAIVGRLVRARVGPDTYQETTRQRVKGILPPVPGTGSPTRQTAPAKGGKPSPRSPF